MKPNVIYQDKYLLVIDKPAGWIVNIAKTAGNNPVLQTWLEENFDYSLANDAKYRSGIVHRLDKETSGVLLVAKTVDAFTDLQLQFKKRLVKKIYTSLVHGKILPDRGVVNVPVGRLAWNRERFGVVPGGRNSLTQYRLVSYYRRLVTKTPEFYSLVKLFPKTGRTHQIRIHMKYIGNPVVSDSFYAGRKTAKKDREWCPRLFLHASKITFKHPRSGGSVSFTAKLPAKLRNALSNLEKIGKNA